VFEIFDRMIGRSTQIDFGDWGLGFGSGVEISLGSGKRNSYIFFVFWFIEYHIPKFS